MNRHNYLYSLITEKNVLWFVLLEYCRQKKITEKETRGLAKIYGLI